ncbi:YbaB/EbfC family nucleoid-associated protein [Mangrovihabitans endophyticus]|uniref:Nucleoid-associated protein n=1 Tax=Mangrovihabitans endophyticus TaxID=1751298 RepID=A0A8J3BWZ2_9ACTN|nr:YbaB/EbfC family nucleoid-associated protein [Mangrovihabitans endophyticus]GGK77609.1 hypothetical protein GCM10012284_09480 [Mangrovihabitans endophyticus]
MEHTHPEVAELESTLDALLDRVHAETAQVAALQEELQGREITGFAGDGEVVVRLAGTGRFTEVSIDPDATRRYDTETLGSLVLEAVNDGLDRLQEASRAVFGPVLGTTAGG